MTFEGGENRGENSLGIREDIGIPEPKDHEPPGSEPPVPDGVTPAVPWFCVLAPIEFDDNPRLVRDEIDDVRADRRLTAELYARDLPAAQVTPQGSLRIGRTFAKGSSERGLVCHDRIIS